MQIYEDYSDEPEVIFRPLTEALYSRLYAVEMADFADDFRFYRAHLPAAGEILEIACGTCRIGRALASCDRRITGIDISLPMLRRAREAGRPSPRLAAMDMRQLAFRARFDAIIIAYNSLNLLVAPDDIRAFSVWICCALSETAGLAAATALRAAVNAWSRECRLTATSSSASAPMVHMSTAKKGNNAT